MNTRKLTMAAAGILLFLSMGQLTAAPQPSESTIISVARIRQALNVTLSVDVAVKPQTRKMSAGGAVYDRLILAGGTQLEIGAPDVPAVARWVAIPIGAEPRLQITAGNAVELGTFKLAPVQPPRSDGDAPPPPLVKNMSIYSLDEFYPGSFAKITQHAKLRGQPMILVELHPYQYNPVSGRLVVYPDLSVNVIVQDGHSPATRLRSPAADARLQRLDPTVNTLLALQPESTVQPLGTGFGDDDNRCEFLIICDPAYETAANTLATWRMHEGMPTVVATTTETGSTTNAIKRQQS